MEAASGPGELELEQRAATSVALLIWRALCFGSLYSAQGASWTARRAAAPRRTRRLGPCDFHGGPAASGGCGRRPPLGCSGTGCWACCQVRRPRAGGVSRAAELDRPVRCVAPGIWYRLSGPGDMRLRSVEALGSWPVPGGGGRIGFWRTAVAGWRAPGWV
ncbi:hypothetical protein NDU88_006195 [Pleurodeles waltl]|uniref:Uncharacterized protein n=1 Tax=Pleurodeles waltl TaxID=8319 RepID=A0AAV7SNW2_PLEWA|nr:hypothetical protein NDU88_006195 [Pleurodeles waltl]